MGCVLILFSYGSTRGEFNVETFSSLRILPFFSFLDILNFLAVEFRSLLKTSSNLSFIEPFLSFQTLKLSNSFQNSFLKRLFRLNCRKTPNFPPSSSPTPQFSRKTKSRNCDIHPTSIYVSFLFVNESVTKTVRVEKARERERGEKKRRWKEPPV